MRVNDSELSMRWNNEACSILDKSEIAEIARWIPTKEEVNSDRDGILSLKKRGWMIRDRWI